MSYANVCMQRFPIKSHKDQPPKLTGMPCYDVTARAATKSSRTTEKNPITQAVIIHESERVQYASRSETTSNTSRAYILISIDHVARTSQPTHC